MFGKIAGEVKFDLNKALNDSSVCDEFTNWKIAMRDAIRADIKDNCCFEGEEDREFRIRMSLAYDFLIIELLGQLKVEMRHVERLRHESQS